MAVTVKTRKKLGLKCDGCDAGLEFEMSDLEFCRVGGDYTDPGIPAAGVRCPDCTTITAWIDAPESVVRRLHVKAVSP